MKQSTFSSVTDQVAEALMAGIRQGRWADELPGRVALAFALYGRLAQVKMASTGPDKIPSQHELVARLIGLGHRRIVMLVREERRRAVPGIPERAILEQLEASGIKTAWDHGLVINRVINWADNVSRGKDDRRESHATARLVIGGTIGPAPRARQIPHPS